MSTQEFMTRDEISAYLKGCTLSDLLDIARERGLVIGGSGKDGKVTKKDAVAAIGAHVVGKPTHAKVRAIRGYHNGMIVGGHGINWGSGEVRVIPVAVYRQIIQDAHPDDFEVLGKVYSV